MCKKQDSMCSDGVLYNTVPNVVLGKFYGGRSSVRIKTACVVMGTVQYGTYVKFNGGW